MRYRSFPGWGKKLEKLLIRFVILCAVALVVTQSLLATDPMRRVIGYVDLEDLAVYSPNASQQLMVGEPTITLYLKEYPCLPKMHVLVNGEPVRRFNDRYVTLQVQDGDLIEIDATFYDHLVEVQVLTTSEEIISPEKGKMLKVTGITSLGKVRVDDSR